MLYSPWGKLLNKFVKALSEACLDELVYFFQCLLVLSKFYYSMADLLV